MGASDGGLFGTAVETDGELLVTSQSKLCTVCWDTYNGSSGRPFKTSTVPFLPNAGRELILKLPLLIFVRFFV